jgi:hypothetical protein
MKTVLNKERKRKRDGCPNSNVLLSRPPMAEPKSGPDYSMLHTPKDLFTYFLRCFHVPQVEDHWLNAYYYSFKFIII